MSSSTSWGPRRHICSFAYFRTETWPSHSRLSVGRLSVIFGHSDDKSTGWGTETYRPTAGDLCRPKGATSSGLGATGHNGWQKNVPERPAGRENAGLTLSPVGPQSRFRRDRVRVFRIWFHGFRRRGEQEAFCQEQAMCPRYGYQRRLSWPSSGWQEWHHCVSQAWWELLRPLLVLMV